MQSTYSTGPSVALPGQMEGAGWEVSFYAASEPIPWGRLCVSKADGTCGLPAAEGPLPSSGVGSPAGIAVYLSAAPPGGFQVGDMVPVLRKGYIWVELVGSAPGPLDSLNVSHSSTTADDRGKFTADATSTDVGAEVSSVARTKAWARSPGLVKVELNLP